MNRFYRSLAALTLSALAFAATADTGDRSTPDKPQRAPAAAVAPVAPIPPVAPLAPDLAGLIDRDMQQALQNLQSPENLKALEALARDSAAMAKVGEMQAMAALSSLSDEAGDARAAVDRGGSDRDTDNTTGPVIDERRPLNADGRIYVNNIAGTIDVATWDRNEVTIGGALGSNVEKLEVTGDPTNLSVVVRLPKRSHTNGDTVLKLRVPVGARIDLESVSADVAVDGAKGPVKINTVSGDVGLALASPEVTVQTVSGDLKLRSPSKLTKINSVSGDIRMTGLQGKLSVETVSGNVELEGGKFAELKLKSISGDMRLDVSLADTAQINGETLSGEIHMIVPTAVSGTALVKSFSGEAYCDGAHTVEHQTGRKREYTWGDGRGAHIELSSFSGDIRIERK
jgi:hypothetical protein